MPSYHNYNFNWFSCRFKLYQTVLKSNTGNDIKNQKKNKDLAANILQETNLIKTDRYSSKLNTFTMMLNRITALFKCLFIISSIGAKHFLVETEGNFRFYRN